MSKIHGKTINLTGSIDTLIGIIPEREELLNFTYSNSIFSNFILKKKDILFMGNDINQSIQKNPYELIMHGILPCGSKTTVILTGIYPYVEIKYINTLSESENKTRIIKILNNLDITYKSITITIGKDFQGYRDTFDKFLKISFINLKSRGLFINHCDNVSIKTYSNDRSTYYRVVSRDYGFNLSNWNIISNYKQESNYLYKSKYVFRIDVNDIKSYDIDIPFDGIENSSLKYENMIIASFDIEMCPGNMDNFPDAEKRPDDDVIFMIGITFHFTKKSDSILSVVLTNKQSDPDNDFVTIVCNTERLLLITFSYLFKAVQPDFITEFNGGGFDWRQIMAKVIHYDILSIFLQNMSLCKMADWELSNNIITRYFPTKPSEIKIDGSTANSYCRSLKLHGYINFDTLIVNRQLEPKAFSHKLNDCLARCNLGSKDDMDYHVMFDIYLNGTSDQMRLVAHYCYIDTVKLQAMLLKLNVIQDRREVSILSFTSLYDGFYYANGSKVRNLIINQSNQLKLKFDTLSRPEIKDKSAKYPGALVFPPIKGIITPLFKLDEFSIVNNIEYDEIEKLYNLLEDNFNDIYIKKINFNRDILDKYLLSENDKNSILHYIEFIKNNENKYPVSGLDFSSLYPSLMMAYNLSPDKLITDKIYANKLISEGIKLNYISFTFCNDKVEAWFIPHNNNPEEYGICATILIKLFNDRSKMKKLLKPFNHKRNELEKEMGNYKNDLSKYPRIEEYKNVMFNFNYYNSKQKALKVFMNTFYGEMGNIKSFMCAVEVAGGVTTMGRYNLKLARRIAEERCNVKLYYGDSVSEDTPIVIKDNNNKINILSIKDLYDNTSCDNLYINTLGKEFTEITTNIKVITENGFIPIKKIIKHKINKKIYRIHTNSGYVDVTEDHSLITSSGNIIKPNECKFGISLLNWIDINNDNNNDNIIKYKSLDNIIQCTSLDLACYNINYLLFGLFYKNGCIIDYNVIINIPISFDKDLLNIIIDMGWIYDFENNKISLKLNKNNKKVWVYKCTKNFSNIIPIFILNTNKENKISYLFGLIYGNELLNINNSINNKYYIIQCISNIDAQGLVVLLNQLNYNLDIEYLDNIINIKIHKFISYKNTNITKIELLNESNYKYVYDIETENHHFGAGVGNIVVHNTDSLYISCDKTKFYDIDKLYFSNKINKLDYATKLVMLTFKLIEECRNIVNNALFEDNGSKFVVMAYEEVMYPLKFDNKKKYCGVKHEDESSINFNPTELFMRGADYEKRGASIVLGSICKDIIYQFVNIYNIKDILTIVMESIKKFFTTQWDINVFIKTAVFKLGVNNVPVRRLISRMEEINYKIIPKPNVRFKYVITKKYPFEYQINGNQIELKSGDKMELIERVKEENLPIDLDYYFTNEITGKLARIIAFLPQFDIMNENIVKKDFPHLDDTEIYKKVENNIYKNAIKCIEGMAIKYSNPYKNKANLQKNTYRTVSKRVSGSIDKIYSKSVKSMVMLIPDVNLTFANIKHYFLDTTYRYDNKLQLYVNEISKVYPKIRIDLIYNNNYNGYVNIINSKLDKILDNEINEFIKYIKDNNLDDKVFGIHDKNINNIVLYIRNKYNFKQICEDNIDAETLDEIVNVEDMDKIINDKDLYISLDDIYADNLLNYIIKIMSVCRLISINNKMIIKAELKRSGTTKRFTGNEI
jgi:DNA polymerase elongation subunit (family B)